jgi:putative endonuclease
MPQGGFVYILTNQWHTVLYTGVTADLPARIEQHHTKVFPKSFTARYNVDKLVYFRYFPTILEAIESINPDGSISG